MLENKDGSGNSPRSRQYSGEVHLRDQDKVPGAQDTVNCLQLLEQEVKPRLHYAVTE